LQIINGNQVQEINPAGTIAYPFGSVWFENKIKYYLGGAGLYTKYYNENSWKRISIPSYYIYSIKGNGLNDIVVCGGFRVCRSFQWRNMEKLFG
jgi:hypothetical protein